LSGEMSYLSATMASLKNVCRMLNGTCHVKLVSMISSVERRGITPLTLSEAERSFSRAHAQQNLPITILYDSSGGHN
jgi:hypothetical protein